MSTLIGIDIQPIDEMEASLQIFGDRYRTLLFTDHELESCTYHFGTASGLAARFAAKEAVLKVLDIRETVPSWRSIEVRTASGWPEILLHDVAVDLARQQGIGNIAVSLSHTDTIATATVVATVSFDPGQSHP